MKIRWHYCPFSPEGLFPLFYNVDCLEFGFDHLTEEFLGLRTLLRIKFVLSPGGIRNFRLGRFHNILEAVSAQDRELFEAHVVVADHTMEIADLRNILDMEQVEPIPLIAGDRPVREDKVPIPVVSCRTEDLLVNGVFTHVDYDLDPLAFWKYNS